KSQIERAAANTVLVVEPDTLRAVDHPRAVHTPTKLGCCLAARLAPHNAGHRLTVESEVAVISRGLFALAIWVIGAHDLLHVGFARRSFSANPWAVDACLQLGAAHRRLPLSTMRIQS